MIRRKTRTSTAGRALARAILIAWTSIAAIGCMDTSLKVFNAAPAAEIIAPADGDTILQDYDQSLQGRVSDADHDLDELETTWYVGADEALCEGTKPDDLGDVFCSVQLGLAATTIRLEVTDPLGELGDATVEFTVTPTQSPTVQIRQPTGEWGYYSDQIITFDGSISDGEDAPDALVAMWDSSLDGVLDAVPAIPNADGDVLGAGYLSEGEHAITLTATDTSGKSSSDNVVIQVGPPNSVPTCEITAPDMGAVSSFGSAVTFEGLVDDTDVPADWLAVEWRSNLDGPIGTSTPSTGGDVSFLTADLSAGSHVVSMTVTDELSGSCIDSVSLVISAPPEVSITEPADGSVVAGGEALTFAAEVGDAEDGAEALAIVWASDVDGELDTSPASSDGTATFSTDALSLGAQTITIRATDSRGESATDSVTLTVNALPTVVSVAISYTDDQVTTSTALTCTATATDPEGDTPTLSYAWSNTTAGTTLDPGTDDTTLALSPDAVLPDDVVQCAATATDSLGGTDTDTDTVTVVNTLPTAPTVAITPTSPTTMDDLVCGIGTAATDPDEEDLSYTLVWTVDGADSGYSLVGADATVTLTVPAAEAHLDEVWSCTATPSDGRAEGPADTASVTVEQAYVDCGDGTMGVPITECWMLENIDDDLDETYCLMSDVDCSVIDDFTAIGQYFPEREFEGILLGNDYTITDFQTSDYGLFVVLEGEVRDLTMADVRLVDGTGSYLGALAGWANDRATIENIHVTGVVESDVANNVGGVVGYGDVSDPITLVGCSFVGEITSSGSSVGGLVGSAASIIDSTVEGTIVGGYRVGGLVASSSGLIENSHFSGDVSTTYSGSAYVGGLVGGFGGTMVGCSSEGTMNAVGASARVGGLAGFSSGLIADSSSSADVSGSGGISAGGLVGSNSSSTESGQIERSFATGDVTGDGRVGGLVGGSGSGAFTDCYALGDVEILARDGGLLYGGGLIGYIFNTTDEMGYISRSFSAGLVTGPADGCSLGCGSECVSLCAGMIGYNGTILHPETGAGYTITDSYWDIDASGTDISNGGEGKTTAEMTESATFTSWDFTEESGTWTIDEGVSYPCLQWADTPCTEPD